MMVTGGLWPDKDRKFVAIDLKTGGHSELPQGKTLLRIEETDDANCLIFDEETLDASSGEVFEWDCYTEKRKLKSFAVDEMMPFERWQREDGTRGFPPQLCDSQAGFVPGKLRRLSDAELHPLLGTGSAHRGGDSAEKIGRTFTGRASALCSDCQNDVFGVARMVA